MAISTITGASTGSTGTVITTGSSGQVIPKAALPTGSVLQVVQTVSLTNTTTTSATPVTTGISASITPSANTSKILVLIDTTVVAGATPNGVGLILYRGGTVVKNSGIDGGPAYYTTYQYTSRVWLQQSLIYLDSPATTSSTTYTLYFAAYSGGGSPVQIGAGASPNFYPTTITLMEIAA